MLHTDLLERMPTEEFWNWWAYYKLEDKDYREKIEKEINLETSAEKTDTQRADDLVEMFKGLAKNNDS